MATADTNSSALEKAVNSQLCNPNYLVFKEKKKNALKLVKESKERIERKEVKTDYSRLCKISPNLPQCKNN